MVTILSEDMENEAYKSHFARAQYRVAVLLRKFDEKAWFEGYMQAILTARKLEGPQWIADSSSGVWDELVLHHD